jgi:hypothetical protein
LACYVRKSSPVSCFFWTCGLWCIRSRKHLIAASQAGGEWNS